MNNKNAYNWQDFGAIIKEKLERVEGDFLDYVQECNYEMAYKTARVLWHKYGDLAFFDTSFFDIEDYWQEQHDICFEKYLDKKYDRKGENA